MGAAAEAQEEALERSQVPRPSDVPGRWRFRHPERPVKVVVLAGSIGAYRRSPYARVIESWCSAIEVKNISRAGLGAWALRRHFQYEVLRNRRIPWREPQHSYWLIYGGGLNSVGSPERTIYHMRETFLLAHARNMQVMALTLTPWGDMRDRRWRGAEALRYLKSTQQIAKFVLGKLSPQEALGHYAVKRADPDASWLPSELPDIGVDLYDSSLRDRQALLRAPQELEPALRRSAQWRRSVRTLDEAQKEQRLAADSALLAQVPQWFMRPELRGFDHIHPNEAGHRLVASLVCQQAPKAWQCHCPAAADVQKAPAAPVALPHKMPKHGQQCQAQGAQHPPTAASPVVTPEVPLCGFH